MVRDRACEQGRDGVRGGGQAAVLGRDSAWARLYQDGLPGLLRPEMGIREFGSCGKPVETSRCKFGSWMKDGRRLRRRELS